MSSPLNCLIPSSVVSNAVSVIIGSSMYGQCFNTERGYITNRERLS